MNDREALLRAICENPEDDTPRLVFADWLQEHGEEERAEFIRLQIELAGLPEGQKKQKRQVRETELLAAHSNEWSEPLKPYFAYYYRGIYARGYAPPVVFRRGFVETLAMDVETFVARGSEAFALSPIRGLRVQDAQSLDDLAKSKDLLRLNGLDFCGTVLSSEASDAPVLFRSKYLANLTSLVARGIDDNGHLDADGLKAIAGSKHLAKLVRIDVGSNWMFGTHQHPPRALACRKALYALGANKPELRELRMRAIGLSDGDLYGLLGQEWMSQLRVLDLRLNGFGDDGCRALCESRHLVNLEHLDLTGSEYYDPEANREVPLGAAVRRLLKKRFGKRVFL
jgi:uncharacterized protein (TIGR02996 family)